MRLREFSDRFLKVRKCGSCGQILVYEHCHDALCPDCRRGWNRAVTGSCPHCLQSAMECVCVPKLLSTEGALCHRKLFFYKSSRYREPQNRLLYYLKKHPNRRMTRFLAEELCSAVRQERDKLLADDPAAHFVLVAVPRGRRARAVHGFDQSVNLAEALSDLTGFPVAAPIHRRFGGREQKRLSRAQRARNLRELMELRADAEDVRGRYVFLLDDIVTTGASMAACLPLLKKAGAKGVVCLSVAQTDDADGK